MKEYDDKLYKVTLSRYTRPMSLTTFFFRISAVNSLSRYYYTTYFSSLCIFILYNFLLFGRVCYYYFSRYHGRGRWTSAGIRLRPAYVKLDGFLRTPPFDRACVYMYIIYIATPVVILYYDTVRSRLHHETSRRGRRR